MGAGEGIERARHLLRMAEQVDSKMTRGVLEGRVILMWISCAKVRLRSDDEF